MLKYRQIRNADRMTILNGIYRHFDDEKYHGLQLRYSRSNRYEIPAISKYQTLYRAGTRLTKARARSVVCLKQRESKRNGINRNRLTSVRLSLFANELFPIQSIGGLLMREKAMPPKYCINSNWRVSTLFLSLFLSIDSQSHSPFA
jgi:hypothetical protein